MEAARARPSRPASEWMPYRRVVHLVFAVIAACGDGGSSQTPASRTAEQMRADFVANASHELRTPLATLLGFLETLQDEETANDPKTRARFLGIMFDEATRMRQVSSRPMTISGSLMTSFFP